jgi:hypothetical protein
MKAKNMSNSKPKTPSQSSKEFLQDMERGFNLLFSPENIAVGKSTMRQAWQSLRELGRQGLIGIKYALDLISELLQELTGVLSFKVKAKPPAELEVDIHLKEELNLPLKQALAPLVDLETIIIGKRIHFQALLDKEENGLRCNINDGFAMRISTLLGFQIIYVKGSAILKRDEKKELVMVTTAQIPGTKIPVTVTIPLKQLLKQARKRLF